jgi:hypothetical protein
MSRYYRSLDELPWPSLHGVGMPDDEEHAPSDEYVYCAFSPYGEEVAAAQAQFSAYPLECTVREHVMATRLLMPLSEEALSVQLMAKRLPTLARWVLNYTSLRSATGVLPNESVEEMRARFESLGKLLRPRSYSIALEMAEQTVYDAYGFNALGDPAWRVNAIANIDMSQFEPKRRQMRLQI